MSDDYPKAINDVWTDVPSNLDTVTTVTTGRNVKTYFFKGNNYYEISDATSKVSRYSYMLVQLIICLTYKCIIPTGTRRAKAQHFVPYTRPRTGSRHVGMWLDLRI